MVKGPLSVRVNPELIVRVLANALPVVQEKLPMVRLLLRINVPTGEFVTPPAAGSGVPRTTGLVFAPSVPVGSS